MKIALMCQQPALYSHQRLFEAATSRGHEIEIVNHVKCSINITSTSPGVRYLGRDLPRYDAVIPRIGASVTFYGCAVLRQFEVMGCYPLNESVAITRSRDKLRSMQLLAKKGVALPVTVFAHKTNDPEELIAMVGGPPVVIKLLEGTQGIGVVLGETAAAAVSIIQAFGGVDTDILVQEYIGEAKGEDIRCIVVGGKVVAAMKRKGKDGEFRSNLHRGGAAEPVKPSSTEKATAIAAAKAMGLNVCGVDLLRSNHGPVVIEVNSSPGLEGVEKATGVDVAGRIIDFLEKHAEPGKTKTKGKG
ncbi:MAG: 30S ribosomal protein S6--L-glutamate ligase [Parvularculaceae bacterium]|nr:30S ribosomal protein S6--L-glutamate ligase [Parvularculaceae bacterium]